jgi:hypothetical protein
MQKQADETPFAWAQLNAARRGIRQIVDEMPALREKVEKLLPVSKDKARECYDELSVLHSKLSDALTTCRLCLLEMGMEQEAAFTGNLQSAVKGFALMTPDYTRFTAGLGEYLSRLPGDDSADDSSKKTNAAIIGRLMNNVKMGYYPTDPDHIDHIVRAVVFPEGVVTNLLDPCCGCGLALRRLATGNNCYTYGVELDEIRAEQAQDTLHRIGVGSFFHSTVSHEAFHLLFLNPPYLHVIREGGGSSRSEKLFLVEGLKHLAIGGLLVFIIPYYRIAADIARILCDNFTDISVYRFMGKEFERYRQVAVFGVRRKRADGSDEAPALLDSVAVADKIPELSAIPDGRYALPTGPLSVSLFKGAVFNELELQRQLKASGSISKLMERSALDNREKRPLLPLNVGQIGLIAGSGMINGLAECDTPHIIKGRIIKQVVRTIDDDGPIATMTETHTNRMVFNLLTPNGFMSLT